MRKSFRNYILLVTILFNTLFNMVNAVNAAWAESEVNVLQAYVKEQTLTVFTNAGQLSDGLKCVIANQNADIMGSGLLSDESALTKTTILVDISTSMPSVIRGAVIMTLKNLLDIKAANEEVRLISFGDELNTLLDFSSDRYDFLTSIEKIVFNGSQSKIYDAIYNTIPLISQTDNTPTYYRTIVITDGDDDTESGITKEELFIKLQNERYPVDVVAVSRGETAENRDLAAIVRMSGGRYNSLNPNTDVSVLAQALGVRNYSYLEAKVPLALLDGTTRQVDISDGLYSMSIDIKLPVFNAAITDTSPSADANAEGVTAGIPETSTASEPEILPFPDETDVQKTIFTLFGDYTIVIYLGIGIILIILIAVIIIAAIVRSKRKKALLLPETDMPMGYINEYYGEKTEFVSDANYSEAQFTIKLSNPNNPSKTWTLPVDGALLIGRAEHCSVRLEDVSVSREQCKIAVQGVGLVVVHLGSTNKTSLNGSRVVNSSPLQSGDTLKFGHEMLRIDYIQKLGSPFPKPDHQRNSNSGKTESIF